MIDLAFLATGAEAGRRLAPILLEAGATVIDQFGAQHQGVPLLAVHGCRCRRVSGRSHAGPDRFTRHLLGDLPWPSH